MKFSIVHKLHFSLFSFLSHFEKDQILFIMSWRTRMNDNNSTNRKSFKIKVNIFVQPKNKTQKQQTKIIFQCQKCTGIFHTRSSHPIASCYLTLTRIGNIIAFASKRYLDFNCTYMYILRFMCRCEARGEIKFEGLDDN